MRTKRHGRQAGCVLFLSASTNTRLANDDYNETHSSVTRSRGTATSHHSATTSHSPIRARRMCVIRFCVFVWLTAVRNQPKSTEASVYNRTCASLTLAVSSTYNCVRIRPTQKQRTQPTHDGYIVIPPERACVFAFVRVVFVFVYLEVLR